MLGIILEISLAVFCFLMAYAIDSIGWKISYIALGLLGLGYAYDIYRQIK
jgi:hypothetical protein